MITQESQKILSEYSDLLNVQDLTKIFEVSKQTIYKEIQNGKFGTPIRIGRAIKIPKIFIVQKYFSA
jgi:predicted DNA-binding transcriptional regulator AlpA